MESDLLYGSTSKTQSSKLIVSTLFVEMQRTAENMNASPTAEEIFALNEHVNEVWKSVDCPDEKLFYDAYQFILHYISDLDVMVSNTEYKMTMIKQLRKYIAELSNTKNM